MIRNIDVALQLVLEPHAQVPWLIQEAVRGGVTCVQWRDKFFNDNDFYNRAVEIKSICYELKVPLIINDRVDIALAIGAAGVHLGQKDLPFEVARGILPASMSIGWTVENFEELEEAEKYDVEYIGISPVLLTSTKLDAAPPFGIEGLQRARKMSRHKLVAIGGMTPENASAVRAAGADGLAVVSAICRSQNPYETAKAFLK
ncbi:MAG: thiamine phosphate synthase [Myxococcaceae bacterium]